MWQRFTERARRIVFFAQEEAGRLGENYISTEHLLLGLDFFDAVHHLQQIHGTPGQAACGILQTE